MSYWACFNCDLLFEVDSGQATACPRCDRMLVRHRPEQVFEITAEMPREEVLDDDDDVTRILPISSPRKTPSRSEVLERTTILPLDGASAPRRRPSAGRSVAANGSDPGDHEVWTSAHTLGSPVAGEPGHSMGPDPTPRRRERRGPKVRERAPKAMERRTLDHAQPRPLERPEEREDDSLDVTEPSQGRPSLFDQVSEVSGTDEIARLVDRHLDESVELMGPSTLTPTRKSTSSWGTGISVAVLVGLIAAALLTRPNENGRRDDLPTDMVETAPLNPIFDGLGIRLAPVAGVDRFDGEEWLALGQQSARAQSGPVPGLTSLRSLTRSIISDEDGPYIKSVTEAFSATKSPMTFGLAFDPAGTAEDIALIVRSLERAGRTRFGLLVEREVDGRVGFFGFTLGGGKIPAIGHAVVQVGNMGVRADIVGRDGAVSDPAGVLLKDSEDGQLNIEALDSRLAQMSKRHPMVRVATVHLETGLDVRSIVRLLQAVRFGPEKERFTEIRLIVR